VCPVSPADFVLVGIDQRVERLDPQRRIGRHGLMIMVVAMIVLLGVGKLRRQGDASRRQARSQ